MGKKLAERLIVELRDKIGRAETGALPLAGTDTQSLVRSQALQALTSLGYSRPAAEKALLAAIKEKDGNDLTIEALIKASLRYAGK